MKVTVVQDIPKPSDDDLDHIHETARNVDSASPEEKAVMREQMITAKEVIIPQYVLDQMTEMGISPDDVVSMLLRKLNAAN